MNCKYCQGSCVKKGKYKSVQKYQCSKCGKYQRAHYRQLTHSMKNQEQVRVLNNEGMGIRSISRVLQIPRTSILMLLSRASKTVSKPLCQERKQSYEVDELYTYVGNKEKPCYIIYAINRRTRQVIDFVVGARTKENIKKVVTSLLQLSPRKIYTDGLPVYCSLIPEAMHGRSQFRTNHIERMNLTIRTHLKRMNRKTICFSKSENILSACFKLYVWG